MSCQEELEELRKQNEVEDAMIDPKDKLHLVKYVKMDGRIVKLWECGICKYVYVMSSVVSAAVAY